MSISGIFRKLDFSSADKLLGSISLDNTAVTARKFYNGDHWQDGDAWIGPAPGTDDTNRASVMQLIQNQFVSHNIIEEVVKRHIEALLGRSSSSWFLQDKTKPQENATPVQESPPEEKPIPVEKDEALDEITDAVKTWWQEKNISEVLYSAVANMLVCGRGAVRLYVPYGILVGGKIQKKDTVLNQMRMIFVESTDPEKSGTVIDGSTMAGVSISKYEGYSVENNKKYQYLEICFVDQDTNMTGIMTMSKDDPNLQNPTFVEQDMLGKPIFFQINRKPLITSQVLENQRLMNMASTMMSRNIVIAGFLERVIMNADLPGEWYIDQTGKKKYRAAPLAFGAGVVTHLKGIEVEDSDGNKTLSTPNISYKDPVPVDTFIATKLEGYKAILQQVDQIHMLMAGESFASGDSRVQARANFATSLLRSKEQVDSLIKWLVEAVIKLTSIFYGNATSYDKYECNVNIKPDTGPLTPEEKKITIELYKAGLLSRQTAMVILGSDNIDAEMSKITQEMMVTTPMEKAQIVTALSKTGWELSWDHLPHVDKYILNIPPRDVNKYIQQLREIAEIQAPSGGNSGSLGGSPKGSTNDPGGQSPGPAGGSGANGGGSNG